MRLEQGETAHRERAERRHIDDAREIDVRLLPDHVEAAGDLDVQEVARREPVVRPGREPSRSG